MNVVKATRQFEEWLGRRTDLIKKDLRLKHTNMKAAVFPFLRATYYRWAQLWPDVCPVWRRVRGCWQSAICTWKISEPGATPKAA